MFMAHPLAGREADALQPVEAAKYVASIAAGRCDEFCKKPNAAYLVADERADEFAADGNSAGEASWRRIINVIRQLANTTPSGLLH